MDKKIIVISAVNLIVGGTLTVLKDCLETLSTLYKNDYRIIAIVHNKSLAHYDGIEYIEIPWAKKNWLYRLYCEYFTMNKISKKMPEIELWFSLHDTTPRVVANKRAVYCHNSFPFYNWGLIDVYFNYKIALFSLFSKWAYAINIKKNDFVITQQQWLREEFKKIFSLNENRIVVAYPTMNIGTSILSTILKEQPIKKHYYEFFFASSASTHKNFHLICEAVNKLQNKGITNFRVYLTLDKNGNRYERWLHKKYGNNEAISFIGYLNKKELERMYQKVDCFIFPSKIETWGLPISEFAVTNKPMLLSDLPYAHTTAEGTIRTAFFDPNNANDLSNKMMKLIAGDYSILDSIKTKDLKAPYSQSWQDLFNILLK